MSEENLEKNENLAEDATDENASTKKKKVKLLFNIKYGNQICSKGETISIDSKDHEEFKLAGVIESNEE